MSEPAKLLSFSEMLQRQEAVERQQPPPPTIAPRATVAPDAIEPLHRATVVSDATVAHDTTVARPAIVDTQYTSVPNGVWDSVMPTLNVYDQSVLWHLYRLSRGYHTDTCRIGLDALARRCNIGKRQVSVSLDRLEARHLIKRIGTDYANPKKSERGTTYRVVLPAARTAPRATVAQQATVAHSATVARQAPNKEHTIKEHTQTQEAVRVGSRFTLAECRRYVDSQPREGIKNPAGLAVSLHRSGEADEAIALFLTPAEAAQKLDVSGCPDCHGTGFWEPGGAGKGVAKCKHERLPLPRS